jgi:hypothetical protein
MVFTTPAGCTNGLDALLEDGASGEDFWPALFTVDLISLIKLITNRVVTRSLITDEPRVDQMIT